MGGCSCFEREREREGKFRGGGEIRGYYFCNFCAVQTSLVMKKRFGRVIQIRRTHERFIVKNGGNLNFIIYINGEKIFLR